MRGLLQLPINPSISSKISGRVLTLAVRFFRTCFLLFVFFVLGLSDLTWPSNLIKSQCCWTEPPLQLLVGITITCNLRKHKCPFQIIHVQGDNIVFLSTKGKENIPVPLTRSHILLLFCSAVMYHTHLICWINFYHQQLQQKVGQKFWQYIIEQSSMTRKNPVMVLEIRASL